MIHKFFSKTIIIMVTASFLVVGGSNAFASVYKDTSCLLVRFAEVSRDNTRLGTENSTLIKRNSELVKKLADLERSFVDLGKKVVDLENIQSTLEGVKEALLIWTAAVEETKRQLRDLESKISKAEEEVDQNLRDAQVPPVLFLVADCGEGDWSCQKWQNSEEKVLPNKEVYPTLLIIPSFSSRGLRRIPEERQSELSKGRSQTAADFYKKEGYEVSVGDPVEGRSGVLLMFFAIGFSKKGMQSLEIEVKKNFNYVLQRLDQLESKVRGMEERVEVLEKGKSMRFQLGAYLGGDNQGFFSGVKFDLVFLTKSRKTPNVSLGAGVGLSQSRFVGWNANLDFAWWIKRWCELGISLSTFVDASKLERTKSATVGLGPVIRFLPVEGFFIEAKPIMGATLYPSGRGEIGGGGVLSIGGTW